MVEGVGGEHGAVVAQVVRDDVWRGENRLGALTCGGAEARAVLRNIFLDGNTFSSSRRVDKYPLVVDFQAGAAVTFQRLRLSYTHLFRTPEFQGQNGFDSFGSVALSLRF